MKTYDDKIDALLKELLNPWDGGPSAGYAMVVDADVAYRAAEMIYNLHNRLESYIAEDYNRQMMGD